MRRLTYVVLINLAHYLREETVRVVNSRFRLCTSLVPRSMIVVFDLGTRLHVRMRTKIRNGVLRSIHSVVNGFIDPGEFETMKTLCGRRVISISFVLK